MFGLQLFILSMNPVTLWQDNALTIARYEMTALEKNILYMVMASIRKDDPITTLYQVSAKELMTLTGEEVKVSDMQRATKKLITRYFETKSVKVVQDKLHYILVIQLLLLCLVFNSLF